LGVDCISYPVGVALERIGKEIRKELNYLTYQMMFWLVKFSIPANI